METVLKNYSTMSPILQSDKQAMNQFPSNDSPSDLLLRHRLKLVEDLWESVLLSECGQDLVNLLKQLRSMCSPEGQATTLPGSDSVAQWIGFPL